MSETDPHATLTRRNFLHAAVGVTASLTFPGAALGLTRLEPIGDPLKGEYPYRGWEDLYRKEWTWDSTGFATHSIGCVAGCAWTVYVKDGIPFREEQTAQYPGLPGFPDMNPRGCQKGAQYCSWMQQPDFLKYPLKRVGERGERKWKRISWDEALTEIADKIIDVTLKQGPGNVYMPKRPFALITNNSSTRMANLLGGIKPDVSSFVGDLYPGVQTVRAQSRSVSTFDDWFTSDVILMWHMNPFATRIPDAHFLTEARYNGGRLVNISVDYNPSSVHADLFVPVKFSTDSHLAAAICNVLIAEKKYKAAYLKEQSDLPFLVQKDNGKFLRESDLKPGGDSEAFYIWDTKTNQAVQAPATGKKQKGKTLALGDIDPALEGAFKVNEIEVTTVFERLKEGLAPYTPEAIQATTGVHPSVTRKLVGWIAEAKALRILDGYNNQKHFDGFQAGRLKILITVLTGHHGTTGSFDTTYEGWRLEGSGMLANVKGKPGRSVGGVLCEWVWGNHYERAKSYYDDAELKAKLGYGINEMEALRKEAEARKWMPNWQSIKDPRVTICTGVNMFRHSTGQQHYRENFLKRCELLVVVDYRMSSGTMFADIVLPAATEYEKHDIRETSVSRFIHLFGQPVKPMFERRTDWRIMVDLARKIQERARTRGVGKVPDPELKGSIDFDTIYDDFTMGGKVVTDAQALRFVMENSKALGIGSYETIHRQGFVALGPQAGKTAPIPRAKPYRPFTVNVEKKIPYGTYTGRLQFYVDHEWFLRFGAATPKPQYAGGDLGPKKFPFVMNSPHTRWGVHSWNRTSKWMLRLQRGTPDVHMNPLDMAEKGVKDGEPVRVFNDHGEFYAMVKKAPSLPRQMVFTEHGWEEYMFKKGTHYNNINTDIINPLELAGGLGHVRYQSGGYNPNRIYYETRVNVQKA